MRKWMLGLVAGLTVLVLGAQVWGLSSNFNFAGQGARALGMGGAFIGIADDATAISWNPAGLGQLDRPELSGVFKFTSEKSSWDPSTVTWLGTPITFESSSQSHFVVNFGSGAIPLKLKQHNLVFALAYQQQFDMYDKTKEADQKTLSGGGYFEDIDGTKTDETSGGIYTISPGFGIQVTPKVMFGAAFNLWTGSPTEKLNRDLTGSASTGTHWTFDATNKMSYGGWNLTAGGLVDVKPVKLGVVVRTPLSLKTHSEYTKHEVLRSSFWVPYDTSWSYRAPRLGDDKLKLPFMFGFGLSVNPTQSFTLAADYELRPFSSATWEDSSGVDYRTYGDTLDWPNAHQIRLGAEYLLMLGGGIVPLRAGFHTDPKLYRHVDMNSTSKGGQVTGMGFSFGTGFAIKHFQLDAAYGFGTASQNWTWLTSLSPSPATSKSKQSSQTILVSGIFKF